MVNFILIVLCISAGMIMSKKQIMPADSYKSINAWVLYIALPALSLRYVPEIEWSVKILLPILGPVLVWCGAWLFVRIYDSKKHLSPGTHTALLVTCGLGNTAFLGFPLISAYYGEEQIHNAVVFDQVTFLIFSTIAVITVLRTSSEKAHEINFTFVIKKVFRFPPFLACMTALILPHFIDISATTPLLDKLVATVSPMALFSIGLQIKLGAIKEEWRLLTAGLIYKLVLAPCIILLLAFTIKATGNLSRISVFEAAMPSHITASLLASQYNLNPRLCNLMVGMGIVTCFATTDFWYWILQSLF